MGKVLRSTTRAIQCRFLGAAMESPGPLHMEVSSISVRRFHGSHLTVAFQSNLKECLGKDLLYAVLMLNCRVLICGPCDFRLLVIARGCVGGRFCARSTAAVEIKADALFRGAGDVDFRAVLIPVISHADAHELAKLQTACRMWREVGLQDVSLGPEAQAKLRLQGRCAGARPLDAASA